MSSRVVRTKTSEAAVLMALMYDGTKPSQIVAQVPQEHGGAIYAGLDCMAWYYSDKSSESIVHGLDVTEQAAC